MNTPIEVVSYNPNWPSIFNLEAQQIASTLKQNCLGIHHVGSTSVPGLIAKPKIDILAVVNDPLIIQTPLYTIGYTAKGEFNIPFQYGFSKREKDLKVNLHVFEKRHPEIELNLIFRDYLRLHKEALNAYAQLKLSLTSRESSNQKEGGYFSEYTLGKDNFIRETLEKAGFQALCLRFCAHHYEEDAIRKLGGSLENLYVKNHIYFVFYQGANVIGYAYITLSSSHFAYLIGFSIEIPLHQEYFFQQCEKWVNKQGLQLKRSFGKN